MARRTPSAARTKAQAARFAGTRRAHRSETSEDYVEAIDQIQRSDGRSGLAGARVTELARLMGVSHVTVVKTVSRLVTQGLVTTQRGKPIQLTPVGTTLARRSRARHQVVLSFLLSLGVDAQQAEIDAEGIEHHVSEQTIRAMRRFVRKARSPG